MGRKKGLELPKYARLRAGQKAGEREKHGECVTIELNLISPFSVHDKALDVQVFPHIRPQF